jgi:transcriptional regulator with XRE-family HTH domain
MTPIANPLRLHRQRAGLTLERLARAVGTTPAQISKLEKGERRLTVDWMARLAPALGIAMGDLLAPAPIVPGRNEAAPIPGAPLPGGEAVFAAAPLAGDPRDFMPVRSAGRGGGEQEMFLEDGPIDYVRRPPSLALVRDAYAIYVVGDSMFPRFRQGQVLHVNPFMPPRPGSGIVLTKTTGAVLIKEFVGRNGLCLQARQYNPAAELSYPNAEIDAVHTIVGLQEP